MIPLRKSLKKKPEKAKYTMADYRKGGEGFIAWCEDNVFIPVYPEGSDIPEYIPMHAMPKDISPVTGRSWSTIWEGQKEVVKEALKMEHRRFVYRLIILCWMRGEGKSLLACLIQIWKFFCWPRQQIMLGANSKDQIKFVHYDIIRDIIQNSPDLVSIVGKKNIQEKEIRLKDGLGNVRSVIRSISSFSGIVSNITGFTFSEIFAMKNPTFFVQLYGSIRNIPNAFGVIDSTVSSKQHVLYQQYQNWLTGASKGLFFSYRSSKTGDQGDFWNPMMTNDQLNDYRTSFPFGEFERYFKNTWEAGQVQVFSDDMIEEMGYFGVDSHIMDHKNVKATIEKKNELVARLSIAVEKKFADGIQETEEHITAIDERIMPVSSIYTIGGGHGVTEPAPLGKLLEIGEMLDTDWLVMGGADMGDPLAIRGLARTIFTCVAKGLPGSRTNPHLMGMKNAALKFVYFMLFMANIEGHEVSHLKEEIERCNDEYDGLDTFCGERYGLWDIAGWCDDRDIEFIPIFPNYARQKEAFKELFNAMQEGRFKTPPIPIQGSKKEDLLKEEFGIFDHQIKYGPTGNEGGWFGSPEKEEKYGIQDDSIYSLGWSIYGAKDKGPADFRLRKSVANFGMMFENRAIIGAY